MTEQLESWNDGPAKDAIVAFVEKTEADDVPVDARIATFDADGTLWCEKPLPAEADFVLRRLAEVAGADLTLRDRQPWKAAYEHDDAWFGQVIKNHYAGDDTQVRKLVAGIATALGGIDVEDFEAQSAAFLGTTPHPTLGRGYATTAYVPMVELLDYLAAHGFSNHIVSGSDGDFMRAISQEVFAIPPERVIGSDSALEYRPDAHGGTVTRMAGVGFLDDGPQKPIQIRSRTGRRPLCAGGNSNGDVPMLDYAQRPGRLSLRLLVLHDDADREFAYTSGAEHALDTATENGWTVVSMKNDFATVFSA
jgi:FMN phosphatase YigB (HAD superfamily)